MQMKNMYVYDSYIDKPYNLKRDKLDYKTIYPVCTANDINGNAWQYGTCFFRYTVLLLYSTNTPYKLDISVIIYIPIRLLWATNVSTQIAKFICICRFYIIIH